MRASAGGGYYSQALKKLEAEGGMLEFEKNTASAVSQLRNAAKKLGYVALFASGEDGRLLVKLEIPLERGKGKPAK